jgi:hypothetical protein
MSALAMAAIAVPPAALAAAAGAALSVLQGIQEPSASFELSQPELAGMRTVLRVAGPPLVAVIGCLPVLLSRSALDNGGDPFGTATTGALVALIVTGLAGAWIHQREQIKAWFANLQEQAVPSSSASRPARAEATPRPAGRSSGRKPTPTKVTTSLPKKR